MGAQCQVCDRKFAEGEMAWAEDWKVIDTYDKSVGFRNEVRYTCDDCEAKR